MTNRIKFVLFFVVLAAVTSTVVLGQQVSDRFETKEQCVAAVKAGTFNYYNSSNFTAHRALLPGETIAPLEERACVDLKIVGRKAYVPQAKGTRYIFKDGKVVAREDCGNVADDLEYVPVVEQPTSQATPVTPSTEPAEPSARNMTTSNTDFVSAPFVDDYIPLSKRNTTTVINTTNVSNTTNLTSTTTVVNKPEPQKGEGWCAEYVPGAKTLWVGGWIGQQFRCHPKRTSLILLGAAAAVPGIAYATNSLWWAGAGNNNNGGALNGYPAEDWNNGPCSLWAVGGKYYGRRPIPNRCF